MLPPALAADCYHLIQKFDKVIKKSVHGLNTLINLNRIYQEDCLSFMSKLRDQKILVDVVVTSPPYNMNKEYGIYKDNKEREKYLQWMKNVAEKSYDILKDDGSFFLNVGGRPVDPTAPFEVATQFRTIYELQNTIHWIKSVSIDAEDVGKNNEFRDNGNISIGHFKPIVSDRYLSDLQEYIFHFTKTGNIKLDKLRIGVTYQDKTNIGRWKSAKQDKRDRGNVWLIPYPTIQEGRPHPAVFPIKLPERCIKLHGIKPNMVVYDPFMGIGNTALACLRLGLNYLGTEIDAEYIKVAQDKIASTPLETYLSEDNHEFI
jgi:site-specific DNA-methyltransferase (adenine-specific)